MVSGETKSGFAFCVDKTRANDMRYLELIAKATNDVSYLPSVVRHLLGDEQTDALYKHVETEDGRVPVDVIEEELAEIMNADEDLKNF